MGAEATYVDTSVYVRVSAASLVYVPACMCLCTDRESQVERLRDVLGSLVVDTCLIRRLETGRQIEGWSDIDRQIDVYRGRGKYKDR